jgi:HlyD family secretion protein
MLSKQPIPLRTVTPDEFLPPISNWSRWGGFALVGLFSGAVALSAFFRYNVTVKAPVVIRPIGDLRVIQATTGGIVEEIRVEANETVQQGDVIAILNDTQFQTEKRQLQTTIDRLQIQLQQVNQQLIAIANQIKAEESKQESAIASAQANLQLSQRQYQNQQAITQADVREAEAAVKFAQEELNRFRQLADTGAVAELQIEEKVAALETAQARLERTQALLNPSAAQVEQSQQAVEQSIANRDITLAQLVQTKQQIQQQQADLQNQLLNRQQGLQQLETDLAQTIIRAPLPGIVQTLELRNSQQVVQLGEIIGYLSPSQTPLVIQASVSHTDVSRIETGQTVQVRIDSCPYPDYGVSKGIVSAIAPDVQLSSSPAVYGVTIQPQELRLQTPQNTCTLQAGMQGRADIVTQHETLLRLLLRKLHLLTKL